MQSIYSQTSQQIQSQLKEWGEPAFRAKQLCEWLFEHRQFLLAEMTNLSKSLKEKLASHYSWDLPKIESELSSEDGASKLLLKYAERPSLIEAVILRYENRTSLCVSSQVGCKLSCSFCQTGKMGFIRHLAAEEILAQFILANQIVQKEGRNITHVVFMGMGEPFDNFQEVMKAVGILTSETEFGLSWRRVTVSTSGIVPKILEFADGPIRASLALSLHGCRDDLRTELMPINQKYPLKELKEALIYYQQKTSALVTIEYILIQDKNCSTKEAKELVHFLHGLRAKINLIPFNPHPGLSYGRPDAETIRKFQEYLSDRGYPSPVRYSKGLSVSAACGQLAAKRLNTLSAIPRRKDLVVSE